MSTVGPIEMETARAEHDIRAREPHEEDILNQHPLVLELILRKCSPEHLLDALESLNLRDERATVSRVISELRMAGHYNLSPWVPNQTRDEPPE